MKTSSKTKVLGICLLALSIIIIILLMGSLLPMMQTKHLVIYYDANGKEILSIKVKNGAEAAKPDVVPTKEGNAYIYYEFDHWASIDGIDLTYSLKNVYNNFQVYPRFKTFNHQYELNFYDEDKETLVNSYTTELSNVRSYVEYLDDRSDSEYYYNFEGWADIHSDEIVNNWGDIEKEMNVYPVFKKIRLVEHIDGIYYEYVPLNNTYVVFDADLTITMANIPSTVNGVEVVTISHGSFANCDNLTSIIIPKTISQVYYSSFGIYGLSKRPSSITSIVVDPENRIYDSRNNCNAIIKTSTNELIFGCNNTIIPNDILTIGEEAFAGCTSIVNLQIPDSVVFIKADAFQDCSSITNISIKNVKIIESRAFSGCSSLAQITMPNVTTIGDFAFYETALTSVLLPSDLKSMDRLIFLECDKLERIYYEGTSLDWDNVNKVDDMSYLAVYFYIENIEDIPNDGGKYWHYDEDNITPIEWTTNE